MSELESHLIAVHAGKQVVKPDEIYSEDTQQQPVVMDISAIALDNVVPIDSISEQARDDIGAAGDQAADGWCNGEKGTGN